VLLVAHGLRYTVAGDDGPLRVLDQADFSVEAGEIVDVVGPSGSGKTTLLRALARLLPGAVGELSLEGTPSSEIDSREWRMRVALLPQIASLAGGTVRSNLLLPWSLKVRSEQSRPADRVLREALDGVGLEGIHLDRDAARLSVGQAARIALLRMTLTDPDVLLLDEPDANLDEDSTAQVAKMTAEFAERGKGVVRVRHHRSDSLASRRLRMQQGRLAEVGE